MKNTHRIPVGQTVVFETLNKYKVGRVVDVKPTSKRIEYTVYGEDGKVYDAMPNKADGSYRIDTRLTKIFCDKYQIEIDELAAEQARIIKETKVIVEDETDTFDAFATQTENISQETTDSESED